MNWKKALSQSDCKIPESTLSHVRIDESNLFFACRYRLKKRKRWSVSSWLSMIKKVNQISQPNFGILKGTIKASFLQTSHLVIDYDLE